MHAVTESYLTDLFERCHRAIYWYCLRYTCRPEDAEDLVQEVFYRASRSVAGAYRRQGAGQEMAWLLRIARHLAVDLQRKKGALPARTVSASRVGREATQLMAFGLQEALNMVEDADREVFVLREVVGLTYAEIAEVTDATEHGVRARLYRVRGQLRELLGGRARGGLKDREKDGRP